MPTHQVNPQAWAQQVQVGHRKCYVPIDRLVSKDETSRPSKKSTSFVLAGGNITTSTSAGVAYDSSNFAWTIPLAVWTQSFSQLASLKYLSLW